MKSCQAAALPSAENEHCLSVLIVVAHLTSWTFVCLVHDLLVAVKVLRTGPQQEVVGAGLVNVC